MKRSLIVPATVLLLCFGFTDSSFAIRLPPVAQVISRWFAFHF